MKRILSLILAAAVVLSLTPAALAMTVWDDTVCPNPVSTTNSFHSYEQVDFRQATCTEGAVEVYRCQGCGKTQSYSYENPLGHDWSDYTVVQPTCTSGGYAERVCRRCGLSERIRETAALGHLWDGGTVTKPATSAEEGVRTYTCQRDASHTYTEAIPKLPTAAPATSVPGTVVGHTHEFGPWQVDEPGDCTNRALEMRKCAVCGETEWRYGDYGDHDWDEWVTQEMPTATMPGLRRRICRINPQHVEEEDIPALGGEPDGNLPQGTDPNVQATLSISPGSGAGKQYGDYIYSTWTVTNTGNVAWELDFASIKYGAEKLGNDWSNFKAQKANGFVQPGESVSFQVGNPVDNQDLAAGVLYRDNANVWVQTEKSHSYTNEVTLSIPLDGEYKVGAALEYEVVSLPEGALQEGDKIGLSLRLTNTGTVDIVPTDVDVAEHPISDNGGLGDDVKGHPLAPGESVTSYYEIVVNGADRMFNAVIRTISELYTYTDQDGSPQSGVTNAVKPIFYLDAEPKVEATLSIVPGSGAGKQYMDYIYSTWTVTNTGNVAWTFASAVISWGVEKLSSDMSDAQAKLGTVCAPGESVSFVFGNAVDNHDLSAGVLYRERTYADVKVNNKWYRSNELPLNIPLDGQPEPGAPDTPGGEISHIGPLAPGKEPVLKLDVVCTAAEPFVFDQNGGTTISSKYYEETVTNIGEGAVTLKTIEFTRSYGSVSNNLPAVTLYPGDSISFGDYAGFSESEVQGDGKVHIGFQITGEKDGKPYASNQVNLAHAVEKGASGWEIPNDLEADSFTVVKTVLSTPADPAGYKLGETVRYQIRATLTKGEAAALNVKLLDDLAGSGALVEVGQVAPGESVYAVFDHTVTQEDVDRGYIYNVARALWEDPGSGNPVTTYSNHVSVLTADKDSEEMYGVWIDVQFDQGPANGSFYVEGEQVPVTLRWKNTSGDTLENVNVRSWGNIDALTADFVVNSGTLTPGEEGELKYNYTVTYEDAALYGEAVVRGWIYAYDKDDKFYSYFDVDIGPAGVEGITPPGGGSTTPGGGATPGGIPGGGPGSVPGGVPAPLPGGSTVPGGGTPGGTPGDGGTTPGGGIPGDGLTPGGGIPGDGLTPGGGFTPGYVPCGTPGFETPDGNTALLQVTKTETSSPNEFGYYGAGDTIEYSLEYVNVGTAVLTDVRLYDVLNESLTFSGYSTTSSLAPGESRKYSFKHTVTEADVEAGWVVNSAMATYCTETLTDVPAMSNKVVSPTREDTVGLVPPALLGGFTPVTGGGDDSCAWELTAHGDTTSEYTLTPCGEHGAAIKKMDELIEKAGKDRTKQQNAWKQIKQLWRDELDKEYQELLNAAYGDARAAVLAERSAFYLFLEAQEALLNAAYPDQPVRAAQEIVNMMIREVGTLCYTLSNAPEARPDSVITGKYLALENAGDAEECQLIAGRNEEGKITFTEIVCGEHENMQSGIDAMLDKAASRAMVGDVFAKGQRACQVNMDGIVNARYKAGDKDQRFLIVQARKSFDGLFVARESLMIFFYPENPETVQEILYRTIREYAVFVCQWMGE